MGEGLLNVTADTNILVRTVVEDDPDQAAIAQSLLRQATIIAVPVPVLCELSWVLRRGYGFSGDDVAETIRAIVAVDAIVTEPPVVDAGLAALEAGGDFADGVIAYQGETLGATVFASFDRKAVARMKNHGLAAADPSELVG